MPVLLVTDKPVVIGAEVDVRIRPRDNRPVYYIDDRWYRLRVEALEPNEPG